MIIGDQYDTRHRLAAAAGGQRARARAVGTRDRRCFVACQGATSLLESELLLMAHRNYSAGLLLRAAWCLWRLALHEIANAHSCIFLQAQEEHQRNETARSSGKMKQMQEAQAAELQQASVL